MELAVVVLDVQVLVGVVVRMGVVVEKGLGQESVGGRVRYVVRFPFFFSHIFSSFFARSFFVIVASPACMNCELAMRFLRAYMIVNSRRFVLISIPGFGAVHGYFKVLCIHLLFSSRGMTIAWQFLVPT